MRLKELLTLVTAGTEIEVTNRMNTYMFDEGFEFIGTHRDIRAKALHKKRYEDALNAKVLKMEHKDEKFVFVINL